MAAQKAQEITLALEEERYPCAVLVTNTKSLMQSLIFLFLPLKSYLLAIYL